MPSNFATALSHPPSSECLNGRYEQLSRVSWDDMREQLRVLLVTTFYPPYSFGGDGVYAWRLANALAADGHLVDVIHCADSYEILAGTRPLPQPLPSHPNVASYPLQSSFPLLVSLASHQSGFPIGRSSQIARATKGKQYDVIHFNNISMFGPGVLALETAGARPIKLFTVLEYWLVCSRHVLWKFGERPCESDQCLQCVIRAGRPPQLWRYTGLIERMASHVDGFLAPSHTVARIHAERGFGRAMDYYLPLFTEVPAEHELSLLPRPFERPYFLFVGRLESLKGLDDLLAAWERVSELDLVIAGDGSEFGPIQRRVAGNPRIHLLGHVPQPDLAALYFHARGCIAPSRFEEPFGLTAIEALAHRTPVIAHSVGGLQEIVNESGGGLLYQGVDQLVEAINRLRKDDSLRDAMAERGYRACLEHWSRPAHLRRYYGLIREIDAARSGLSREAAVGKNVLP
jgi:glycosyltransferase involved in cell wall biosynthesis